MSDLPSGTITFLFTDVQDSTRLWETHPDVMQRALKRHDEIIESLSELHRGTIVRPRGEGDSRFVVFKRAIDAVKAAVAIQQAFLSEDWPEGIPLQVRMGVHTGEGHYREGDYYGTAVNRGAQLRGLADGGQALLSRSTYELVQDKLPGGIELINLGKHPLKGLKRPENIYQLTAPGLPPDHPPIFNPSGQYPAPKDRNDFLSGDRGTDDRSAVAVLPFENLSGTEEAEFLAAGLQNDLITELSRIHGLTVISRTSVMGYRGNEKPITQIGKELGAGTIIEGAVQSAGKRVRLTAQLIDAKTDNHRWAERYDRNLNPENLFAIQSELTEHITNSLQQYLGPDPGIPHDQFQTKDMEAYRLVSLGQMQIDRRTKKGFKRALQFFKNAVKQDPEYVLAWAGLADTLTLMEAYGHGDAEILLSRAQQAVEKALELDPYSPEAHTSLGLIYSSRQDGPAAMREWERAIQIKPSHALAHSSMSWVSNLIGQADQALKSATRAVELDPLSAEVVNHLVLSYLANEESEKALVESRRALELAPKWETAILYSSFALYALQRYQKAISALEGMTVGWAGKGAEATLALSYIAVGDEASAKNILTDIGDAVDPFAAGLIHAGLGNRDRAFELFFDINKLGYWPCLAVHNLYREVWDQFQHDPRYHDLVHFALKSWNVNPKGGHSNV